MLVHIAQDLLADSVPACYLPWLLGLMISLLICICKLFTMWRLCMKLFSLLYKCAGDGYGLLGTVIHILEINWRVLKSSFRRYLQLHSKLELK